MATIYTASNQSNAISPDINVNGTVQIVMTGDFGERGRVAVQIKQDGVYHTIPSLVFYHNDAITIDLRANDVIRVSTVNCVSVGIVVRD